MRNLEGDAYGLLLANIQHSEGHTKEGTQPETPLIRRSHFHTHTHTHTHKRVIQYFTVDLLTHYYYNIAQA
jgi:hypothetical protein